MSRVLDVWVLAGSPGCWISRKQIQEAEEIAALNLAKFRKAQQELEEVEERAKLAALI